MLTNAARELASRVMAFHLRSLVGDFYTFYSTDRMLVDGEAVKYTRLAPLAAMRQMLHNGLAVTGVSASQKM